MTVRSSERARSGWVTGPRKSATQWAALTSSASVGMSSMARRSGRPSPSQRSCEARIAACTPASSPINEATQAPAAVCPLSTPSGRVRTATPASCSNEAKMTRRRVGASGRRGVEASRRRLRANAAARCATRTECPTGCPSARSKAPARCASTSARRTGCSCTGTRYVSTSSPTKLERRTGANGSVVCWTKVCPSLPCLNHRQCGKGQQGMRPDGQFAGSDPLAGRLKYSA